MDNEAQNLLDDTVAFCKRDGQDSRLTNMLAQSVPLSMDDETFTIQAPTRFAYSYLEKQRSTIEPYLEEITFLPLELKIVSPAEEEQDPAPAVDEKPQKKKKSHKKEIGPDLLDLEAESGVKVTNTLSSDDFKRIMAQMKGEDPDPLEEDEETEGTEESEIQAEVQTSYSPLSINSKYTFENFVFGDENKHAYQSSLRFAAFAEEPGTCTSLFIYGNSGLGKTHLLYAIKNYLAKEKPYIKVKYANSQAYLDDYMHDLGAQRGPGDPIMKEYRNADILIIDDIQNIIGKQASIEYFFQLVDEFIRNDKKIVIASDRAPKKLGLDERLTSRFNAGMLCLVSEPGFEMKYAILKRYYENIILGSGDLAHMSVDSSLLSAFHIKEGHLTDQQLRYMAEISGNNIRELESFCERCASLSSEREEEGGELTTDDIDRIANEYFDTAHKVIHIDTVQKVVEEYYHVSHEELIGPRRTANIAFARHVAVYLANNLCEMTTPAIGAEFGGRDHSTVLNSIKVIENRMKEDRSLCEDLQQLKNKIILKS